jgi:hypothetical protein
MPKTPFVNRSQRITFVHLVTVVGIRYAKQYIFASKEISVRVQIPKNVARVWFSMEK